MCDLTGFVIITDTAHITAEALVHTFMQEFLLKVGLCGLIIVDAGSTFLGQFKAMCWILSIHLHTATQGNHKAVSVEHFW